MIYQNQSYHILLISQLMQNTCLGSTLYLNRNVELAGSSVTSFFVQNSLFVIALPRKTNWLSGYNNVCESSSSCSSIGGNCYFAFSGIFSFKQSEILARKPKTDFTESICCWVCLLYIALHYLLINVTRTVTAPERPWTSCSKFSMAWCIIQFTSKVSDDICYYR